MVRKLHHTMRQVQKNPNTINHTVLRKLVIGSTMKGTAVIQSLGDYCSLLGTGECIGSFIVSHTIVHKEINQSL